MAIHRAGNCINGRLAKIFATIDGKVEEIAIAKSFESTVEKQKSEVNVMGDLWTQHKATGLSGSGTMNLFYCSPLFRKLMLDYGSTKIDSYFSLTFINNDPGSKAGIQTVVYSDVNIDSVSFGKGDADNAVLEEDIPFTFSGVEVVSHFKDTLE